MMNLLKSIWLFNIVTDPEQILLAMTSQRFARPEKLISRRVERKR